MRWRPGPQNEVMENDLVPDMPNLDDDDEGVGSRVDDDRSDKPSRGRLGGSSTPSLPPADVDEYDDAPEPQKASDGDSDLHEEDDPGIDHAEDPQAPAPVWKPQDQQSTCEFMHTIANYSQKRESGCKKAEYSATTVDEFGNRWRLIIYVNGNGRASNHHLSLFLQVADADDLPFGWKKAVSYVLTLEHPSGGNLGYAKRNPDKTFKLCPKAIDWGWSQFITSDRIQQEGYVSNDSLTVRASVTVKSSSVNIDADDAELYLKSAVEDGNAEAVKICLAQGAGVNCQFKDDLYTPLHTACSSSSNSGSLEVLNLLLERGADGNACNKWRETPLLIAANNGHHAAVNALLEHGADPSLCSEAGWSALTFAAHKGYNNIVTLLLKAGAPVNVRVTEDLSTPLHKACAGGKPGHLSAVKQLLENGADVHALNKWRETPLLTAANHGQADAVDDLLKHGADPCKCTDTGWSPLSIAAYKGHDDVVRLLLEEGAPTEEADPTLSALLQAATKGLPDTVELLLRHGADHTVTTKKGDTALSILVEQNLIDAAVEMVTEYKASVPRCSRDRKKVQRARLLINLRVKQQQREGLLSMDDDETDDETDESLFPLNDNGPPSAKKNRKGNLATAEASARAAEEALLLELAQEESKAQQEEAVANSKRAKKKKKKDRERQQKLKEEEEEKQKEALIAKERERQRVLREEKEHKIRMERLQEEKQRAMKEAAAREKKAKQEAAQRREKEERERAQRLQALQELASEKTVNRSSEDIENRSKNTKAKGRKVADEGSAKNGQYGTPSTAHLRGAATQQSSGRGWETKSGEVQASNAQPTSNVVVGAGLQNRSVEDPNSSSRGSRSVDALAFETPQPQVKANSLVVQPSPVLSGVSLASASSNSDQTQTFPSKFELPQVVLYRQEKLGQLFQRCAVARSQPHSDPLGSVNEDIVKTVVYRWIVRAAHDSAPFLDSMIPSWTDFDYLCSFLQRQFIAESRKAVGASATSSMVDMESVKEAGASFARLCDSLAKDLVQFRQQLEKQTTSSWTDSSLGLSGSEVMRNGLGSMVCIDWAGRAQVYFSTYAFAKATERHVGSSRRLLTALFAAKKRYEIMGMLVAGTAMDFRLTPSTLETLHRTIGVKIELWSDPFSVCGDNLFFGCFDDVDASFGGLSPFGTEDAAAELAKLKRGGAVAIMPPLDAMVARQYLCRIVDLLEMGDQERVPLSFIVILHAGCFRDSSRSPSFNDAIALDPRLGDRHRVYIRCAEVLPAGQHAFQTGEGEGVSKASRTNSLFLLLQNETGKNRHAMTEASLVSVIRAMSPSFAPPKESSFSSSIGSIGYQENYMAQEPVAVAHGTFSDRSVALSPSPHVPAHSDFGAFNSGSLSNGFGHDSQNSGHNSQGGGVRPKRGRLFALVDDDDDVSNVDVVSGMLSNLDVFKNHSSQEIDIEAISLGLMGIGGGSLGESGGSTDNMRTTSRFLG